MAGTFKANIFQQEIEIRKYGEMLKLFQAVTEHLLWKWRVYW